MKEQSWRDIRSHRGSRRRGGELPDNGLVFLEKHVQLANLQWHPPDKETCELVSVVVKSSLPLSIPGWRR